IGLTSLTALVGSSLFHKRKTVHERTFIYSLLTRGRPLSAVIFLKATAFCIGNGLLQAYYLVYCAEYPEEWYT
ncbi:steroid 5 alpha-reductase 2, isoform CRA_a, partial [Mus musculus]